MSIRLRKFLSLSLFFGGLVAIVLSPTVAGATVNPDQNHESYWENYLSERGIAAECFKHEADSQGNSSNAHGSSSGTNVVLNEFNPDWFGDHWALLVVKGGDDRNVFENPVAGQAYQAPVNNGGNVPKVSHWIVCKGETPQTTTSTTVVETTTSSTSTSTTVPETTTTTEPPTTTTSTTEPPTTTTSTTVQETTTTTAPTTTTTDPDIPDDDPTTTTTVITTTTPTTAPPTELARTGTNYSLALTLAGVALVFLGFLLPKLWKV